MVKQAGSRGRGATGGRRPADDGGVAGRRAAGDRGCAREGARPVAPRFADGSNARRCYGLELSTGAVRLVDEDGDVATTRLRCHDDVQAMPDDAACLKDVIRSLQFENDMLRSALTMGDDSPESWLARDVLGGR